ncbi:MAG TPA: hypothetical protein VHW25_08390 [Steroidobacteraceae bacterium]|jgi:hypothetical protein|nr:hypothetical protein [Steroidobacteraceae bacterium]
MYQKPTAPRSIGGVLDDTLQLYKASFSRCLVPALLTGIVVAVLGLYQVSRLPTSVSAADFQAYVARSSANTASSSLFSLLGVLVDLVFYSIMIYIIAAVSRGESPSIGASLSPALRRVPANIGASILLIIIATIGFIVACVPLFISTAGNRSHATLAQMAGRLGPAALVCLVLSIPVAYVVVRMMLYMVPLVAESEGPVRSLATSWRVVGGHWWRTLTLVGVMAIIVYVLTILVLGIAGGIGVMIAGVPSGAGRMIGAAAEIGAVVAGILRVFTGPLMAALLVSIYKDLQLRKGGGDLEARLGALPRS